MIKYVLLLGSFIGLSLVIYSSIALLHLNKGKANESHEDMVQKIKVFIVPLLIILGVCNHGKSMDNVSKIQQYSPQQLGV